VLVEEDVDDEVVLALVFKDELVVDDRGLD